MDNHQMHDRDPEDIELARRLEAYAEARLSPELAATTRMRANVMAAAHRHAALARPDVARAAAVATAQIDRTRRSTWLRPMTALLAAGLTLAVGVGSVAAAQAGGPLYGVRIWSETLTLPASANERAQAELRRLEGRLAEAAAATAKGDLNAANAALDAFAAIVNEATHDAGNDVSAAATLDVGVRSNIDVLTVLADRVPEQARDAIEQAIKRSDSALDELHGQPAGGPPETTPGRGPNPAVSSNPNKPTPDAVNPTPRPHPTPKPQPTPKAEAKPNPDRTPRGGPPSDSPGNGNNQGG
jgi:hypothetical protein